MLSSLSMISMDLVMLAGGRSPRRAPAADPAQVARRGATIIRLPPPASTWKTAGARRSSLLRGTGGGRRGVEEGAVEAPSERSNVEVQRELPGVRPEPDGIDLVLPLVVDPGL